MNWKKPNLWRAFLGIGLMIGSAASFGIEQDNITITEMGTEGSGSQLYIGITPNPNNCVGVGVYFNVAAGLNQQLATALTAKISGKTVRIDYNQSAPGQVCYGFAIYIQ